jgi:hypothetical protein
MKWIDVSLEQPTQAGKYVVKTRTTMGSTHKIEAICTFREVLEDSRALKGFKIKELKAHFNVSNQIVTHWLKETE